MIELSGTARIARTVDMQAMVRRIAIRHLGEQGGTLRARDLRDELAWRRADCPRARYSARCKGSSGDAAFYDPDQISRNWNSGYYAHLQTAKEQVVR